MSYTYFIDNLYFKCIGGINMQIDLEDELYKELKDIYENQIDKLEYPNFRNLVNRVLKAWAKKKKIKDDMSDIRE